MAQLKKKVRGASINFCSAFFWREMRRNSAACHPSRKKNQVCVTSQFQNLQVLKKKLSTAFGIGCKAVRDGEVKIICRWVAVITCMNEFSNNCYMSL